MTDDSALDELPVGTIVVVGALLLAALTLPTFAPGTGPEEPDASNGTIVTPDGTELEEVNRGPIDGLNVLPGSHLMDDSPTVHASTGAQTMRVETTTVDGEPALNLSDDRTHDGRWVAVPTDWFNQTHGEIPSVARIAHEDSGTYTEPLQVRGDSAAFFVRGFSTNTVTFGGELVIQDRPAVDGTRHTYQLDSRDSVDDVSINLTGVENTATDSASAVRTNGESLTANVGGTASPRDETVTLTGRETRSSWTGSGSGDGSVTVNGNQPAEDISATLEGSTATSNGDQSWTGLSNGASRSLTSGNIEPTGPAGNEPQVTLTTSTPTGSRSYGISTYETALALAYGDGTNGEITMPNVPGKPTGLTLYTTGSSSVEWDIYAVTGETADGDPSEGTKVASNVVFDKTGANTVTFDQKVPSNGQDVSFGFVGSGYDRLKVKATANAEYAWGNNYFNYDGSNKDYAAKFDVAYEETADVTVDAGGASTSWSGLGNGATVSSGLDIPASASAIDVSTTTGSVDLSIDKTDRTATEDPALDLDGDGSDEISHTGILTTGETTTVSAPDGALSPGANAIDASTSAGALPSWTIDATAVTATEDPSVTVGGSTVSHSGVLADGETVTESVSLATGSNTLDVSTVSEVAVEASWTEVSQTRDPVVELNGHSASYNGTLAEGETVDLGGSVSWLEDGQNNVTVHVGDGSYSGDGPEPQVELEFRHDLESPRTVNYESEALSERYNISKTYTTSRANATLTIPHARTVLSMRALDYRLNETGSWSSVPQSAANLSGTTLDIDVSALAGDPVPEGTTVEVRSTGSRVDAHESSISVVRATPVGFDMDSRIRLDSWGTGSYLEVGETPQGGLVYYAENESYSAESDYVELFANGDQRLYAPNASSGSELTLQTLPARVSPERNSMRVRVPESANATDTEFVVEPASVVGDSWTAEYVAGTDGQWYAVVDSAGEELGAAEKPSPITVDRDDVGLVSIVSTEPPSASTDGAGGGVFDAVTTGNLPSLLVLFGSVGMLFVAGTRPAASREAIDGFASGLNGAVSRVPRVGPALGGALESAVSGAGSGLVSVGENRLLTAAVGAAVVVAAAQADLFTIGSETGAIISVAGIAVGSLYVLREAGEFTTARWIAIVGVAGVVALQGLGEGDLLAQFVNSDAFLIAVLIGGYAVIQLVREYRQNNSPDDDRPQIVIGGNIGSGDDEGSD